MTLGLALGAVALGSLSEVWVDQDRTLAKLKREVRQLAEHPSLPSSPPLPPGLLLGADQSGSASDLAKSLQQTLAKVGLEVLEFRILEDRPQTGWVRFHLRGPIGPWLTFLRGSPPSSQRLFRDITVRIYENAVYDYTFEVGYARVP